MKITASQLRKIIAEEVQKSLTEGPEIPKDAPSTDPVRVGVFDIVFYVQDGVLVGDYWNDDIGFRAANLVARSDGSTENFITVFQQDSINVINKLMGQLNASIIPEAQAKLGLGGGKKRGSDTIPTGDVVTSQLAVVLNDDGTFGPQASKAEVKLYGGQLPTSGQLKQLQAEYDAAVAKIESQMGDKKLMKQTAIKLAKALHDKREGWVMVWSPSGKWDGVVSPGQALLDQFGIDFEM